MPPEKQISRSSPSVVARLMGLDTLPPLQCYKPLKESKNRSSKTPKDFQEKLAGHAQPCQKRGDIRRKFLNRMLGTKHMQGGTAFIRQSIVNSKSLSANEKLWRSDEFNSALDVLESNKDLFLRLLREPQSLSSFSYSIHDHIHSPPNDSMSAQIVEDNAQATDIVILKPSVELNLKPERTVRTVKSADTTCYGVSSLVKPSKEAMAELCEHGVSKRLKKASLLKLHEKSSPHNAIYELLPPLCSKSMPISFYSLRKQSDQASPVSVLELPSKNNFCSHSIDRSVENTDTVWSDDELDGDMLQALRDEEGRDYSYLVDVLIDSGVLKKNRLFGAPRIGVNIFEKLEKKYRSVGRWSRIERELLFDVINSVLSDNFAISLVRKDMRSWRFKKATHEGFIEGIWQAVVAKRRKENSSHLEEMAIGEMWLDVLNHVEILGEMVGKMVCEHLIDVLVEELVFM